MKLNAAGLGIRIKQARTAKGWTQTELAKALGVQRSSVVRWETGVSVARNIPLVSKTLGQSAEWFLERADEGAVLKSNGDSNELKHLRAEVRRLQKDLRNAVEEERDSRHQKLRSEISNEPKSVTVNIINEKAQVTETHTITEKHTEKNVEKHSEKHVEPKVRKSRKIDENVRDQAMLADILKSWNGVTEEARLMAALLITGDWSYKLKLWNRNVAVGDDVLKAIRHLGKKSRISNRTA